MRITLASAVTAAAMLAFAASANAAETVYFQTPSGNIVCGMGGGMVGCEIRDPGWTAPPKPPSCDGEWGNRVQVDRNGPGRFVCTGDEGFFADFPDAPPDMLGSGDRIAKNRFRCTGKVKGVRCVNRKNGHGFVFQRNESDLF